MMIGFVADSRVANEVVPSPNHDERLGRGRPDMIVMHYTGMLEAAVALDRLCSPESKVSAHYVVFEDGRVVQCVPERRRAWHAGISSWEGESDINSRSIGIEICNPGHDFGAPEFAEAQIAAVIALGRDILARRVIHADRVVGHSDVAPGRKNDPGEKFPWSRLYAAGIGHWVEPVEIDDAPGLGLGDEGRQVLALQRTLAGYGYGLAATGRYDAATRDVVVAFQRHFRPSRVDGIADRSTIATLHCLCVARDRAGAAAPS
jgi:N-acetylmuramoyl-L-alanine amidase